jgi:hypothetical protein
MEEEWNRVGLSGDFVQPLYGGIPKNKSGASGIFRMIERGLRAQVPGTPFWPFLLMEDDVVFSTPSSGSIDDYLAVDVPENADILYVGLSNRSMNDHQIHPANYYTSVDRFPDVVRIKHMLASHGILVCSALGAAAIQRTMVEVFLSDQPWDVPLAFLQPYYQVYALRRPWVYREEEAFTQITLEGPDNPLPENWVNRDGATSRMGEGS